MRRSRREFLTDTSIGLVGAAVLGQGRAEAQTPETQSQQPPNLPPGAPPAFGTAPAVGPEVSPITFSEAEKLVQVEMSKAEIAQAASSWRSNLAALYERRTGPHKIELEPTLAPYSGWIPYCQARSAVLSETFSYARKMIPAHCPRTRQILPSLH